MSTKQVIPILALAFCGFALSCTKENANVERSEYIEIYKTLEDAQDPEVEPVDELCVSVLGGEFDIVVKTNVDLTASWQDGVSGNWGQVVSYGPSEVDGCYIAKIKAKRISSTSNYYTRRTGTLLLTNKPINLGKFLKVHQGSIARISCNFSWLLYGLNHPFYVKDDTPIASWTAGQKSYNYSSTPFADTETAHCYGRNGYIRLGDAEGRGGDIITPYAENMHLDSLVMLSFNAVAFTAQDGTKDQGKITVEILGGGVIADTEKTSIEFTAPYYDTTSSDLPTSMWDRAGFLVFVKNVKNNELGLDTQFRIIAGDLNSATAPNRVYVDNIYVRTLNPKVDQDYYTENNGSGPDIILGAPVIEE